VPCVPTTASVQVLSRMFLDLFVRLFLCTKLSVEIRDSAYSETAIDHNFRLKSNPLSTVYNFFPWHNLSSGYDTCAICVCIFIIFVLLSFHNRILIITFKLTSPVTAAAAKKKATSRPDSSRGAIGWRPARPVCPQATCRRHAPVACCSPVKRLPAKDGVESHTARTPCWLR
jgi:hypothetical protein